MINKLKKIIQNIRITKLKQLYSKKDIGFIILCCFFIVSIISFGIKNVIFLSNLDDILKDALINEILNNNLIHKVETFSVEQLEYVEDDSEQYSQMMVKALLTEFIIEVNTSITLDENIYKKLQIKSITKDEILLEGEIWNVMDGYIFNCPQYSEQALKLETKQGNNLVANWLSSNESILTSDVNKQLRKSINYLGIEDIDGEKCNNVSFKFDKELINKVLASVVKECEQTNDQGLSELQEILKTGFINDSIEGSIYLQHDNNSIYSMSILIPIYLEHLNVNVQLKYDMRTSKLSMDDTQPIPENVETLTDLKIFDDIFGQISDLGNQEN